MAQQRPQGRKPRVKSKSEKIFDIYLIIGLFGILAGIISIYIFYPDTLITISTIFTFILIFGIIVNLAMLPFVLKKNPKGKTLLSELGIPFYFILNFAGGGALFTGLLMMFNFAGRSADVYTETYEIGDRDPNYVASTYSGVIYQLIDNKRPEEIELRWFDLKEIGHVIKKGHIQWRFSQGLFGIEIFEGRGFVSDLSGSDYTESFLIGDGFQD